MAGKTAATEPLQGVIGNMKNIELQAAGGKEETVEFTDFRSINVEDTSNSEDVHSTQSVHKEQALAEEINARLGSGAKSSHPKSL
jgi:cytochrome c biogenesis protein